MAELEDLKRERQSKFLILKGFIKGIKSCALVIEEFDEKLWAVSVDKVSVMADGRMMFRFKAGTEIEG